MNFYIIGIVLFAFVFIGSIFLLIYYIMDEKKLVEVTNERLKKLGKDYSKEEFENKMFEQYVNILSNIAYEDYSFLKDAVSDEEYNRILLIAKRNRETNEKMVINNIKKEFSKLIGFDVINDLEIAKLWVRYSCVEYVTGMRKEVDENGQEQVVETVVSGDKNSSKNYEYILTYVKNKSQTENIVCPSCGFQSHILTNSNCIRCEAEIIPKKMHWVFVEKISTNISKN